MKRRTLLTGLAAITGSGVTIASTTPFSNDNSAHASAHHPGFDTGMRRLHVSAGFRPPIDNDTPEQIFETLQEAIDAARPGDVITVAAGVYREKLTIRNLRGTRSLPVWIVAEQRGSVTISDTWEGAENGDVRWIDAGGGVFHTPYEARPYIGEHNGDFLMAYLSEHDLRAASISAYSVTHRTETDIAKPAYGFAFVPSERRVYIRLRNGLDPNGQAIKLTSSFARNLVTVSNANNVILDGFIMEGAGNTQAVLFDESCLNVTVRNCVFRLSRHGVRCPSNTLLETCTYQYVGFDRWTRDLFALDGTSDNGVFVLAKSYYHADAVGASGGRGNALLEGSLNFGYNFSKAQERLLIDRCLIGPCFDGSRIGEFNDSEIRNSIFYECRDDGFENEGPKGKPSTNNRIHDCRFINCYHDASHQGRDISGDAFFYRNLIERNDPSVAIPDNYSIKMIKTPKGADVYYYHNTWIIDYGSPSGGTTNVWADFGGPNSNANEIEDFVNNIVVIPHDLTDAVGPNPVRIASNAVVAPSASTAHFLTVNGGVYSGAETDDMRLEADRSLKPDSPARSIGKVLPANLPDSRNGPDANNDVGAFPFGERPGSDWPRPVALIFDENLPSRWTSPGLSK